MLWDSKAKILSGKGMLKSKNILESSHPSNLANTGRSKDPFKGNNHFYLCNSILKKDGIKQINWAKEGDPECIITNELKKLLSNSSN